MQIQQEMLLKAVSEWRENQSRSAFPQEKFDILMKTSAQLSWKETKVMFVRKAPAWSIWCASMCLSGWVKNLNMTLAPCSGY